MVATKGDGWFLAPSLIAFINSVDAQFPNRDHSSDGSIGDASHAARASDHNPCWNCTGYLRGIVRAIDVDIDGRIPGRDLRTEILNSTIGHPAVWYVISNRKIYSRTYDWRAREYTGSNPHEHHVHISIERTESAAKNATLLLKKPAVTPPKDDEMTPAQMLELKEYVDERMQAYSLWLDMRSRRAELLVAKANNDVAAAGVLQTEYNAAYESWKKAQNG